MSFIAKNQFFVFLFAVAIGCVLGLLFTIKNFIKHRFKNKVIKVFCDISVFIVCAICFNYLTYIFEFPNLRTYIFLGFFVGIFLHLKSFDLILAKLYKKIYNIIKYKKNKRKNCNE